VLLSHAIVLPSLTGCRRIYAARYLNFTTDESESIRGDRMANLSASDDIDAAEEEFALAQRRCTEIKAKLALKRNQPRSSGLTAAENGRGPEAGRANGCRQWDGH